MKHVILILLGMFFPLVIWAQGNGLNVTLPPGINPHPDLTLIKKYEIDEFVGTWQYVGHDTVFTIKLVKGNSVGLNLKLGRPLFGGYSLSVGGVMVDNYIENIGTIWHQLENEAPVENIYIIALTSEYPTAGLGTKFYDQQKKHLNGKGIMGGYIELIESGKLHWFLDEYAGLYEGDADNPFPELIGFSVPTDVIMTKISDE